MSTAGQAAGYVIGGVVGAAFPAVGWVIGAQIGGMIGGYIDPPKGANTVGPRLEDLTVQTSTYGAVLPRIKGTIAVTGNVFWLEGDKIKEHEKTEKVGGKGGPTSKQTTFSYTATFAVGLSQQVAAPIAGIRRLWLANTLVYDAGSGDINSIIASNQQAGVMFKVYDGSDDQLPDPRMQADKGAANVSGYPGRAYIVFYDLDLTEKYNNTLMATQVKAEVVTAGSVAPTTSAVDSIFTGNLGDPTWGNSITLLGLDFTASGATYSTYEKSNYGDDPALMNFGRMEFPYLDEASSIDIVSPTGGYGYAHQFMHCCQSDDALALQIQNEFAGYSPVKMRWFYQSGIDCWLNYVDHSAIPFGEHTRVVFDRGETFLAGDNTTAHIVKVDRYGSVLAASAAKYPVNQFGVSESYLFALLYTPSSDNLTTTVYKFDRDTLALLDTYVQIAVGGRGTIQVIDDETFYTAAWKSGYGGHIYKWEGGVVIADYGDVFPTAIGEKSRLNVVTESPFYGYLLNWTASTNSPGIYAFYSTLSPTAAKLRDIVTEECALVGISAGDLDLTELVNSDVRGYRVSQAGSVRSVLEQLQAAFPFDVIQSGYKLKFKSRGGASVLTVPESDLGAHTGNDTPSRFMLTTEMPSQVPAKVTFNFMNADREYDPDEQSAAFTAQDVKNSYTVSLPLVMTPTEALQAADVLLKKEQQERTSAGTFWLPPTDDYRKLEAADVIDVTAQSRTHTIRLTKVSQLPDGRIECDGKLTASAAYASTALAQPSLALGQTTVPLAGSSELLLLDIPRLVSDQDVPGISLAMYGYTDGWPGGIALRSDDSGETYTAVASFSSKTEVFTVSGTPETVQPVLMDVSSVLIATPAWDGADLSSITNAQLFALGNLAAYGAAGRWEIIGFKTVTDNGNGTYTLQNFMRGRFGTEWAMPLHATGDRLIMLDLNSADFAGLPLTAINSPRLWRGVTAGESIDSDADESFTYGAVNLKPLAPVNLSGNRHPETLDWTLTAVPRSRTPVEPFSGLPTPLGESSEAYDVEIWNSDYSTLKRTFSGLTSASAPYTAVQQIADFGSEQSTLYVKWYPLSATVGRGYPLQSSIYRHLPLDPYGDLVTLLLHMDDAGLTDVTGKSVSLFGNVAREADAAAFGGYWAALDGDGDYLRIPYAAGLDVGSGDFTVQARIKVTAYRTYACLICGTYGYGSVDGGTNNDGWELGLLSDGKLFFGFGTGGGTFTYFSSANAVGTGAIKNVGVKRVGNDFTLYIEGTADGTYSSSVDFTRSNKTYFYVGSYNRGDADAFSANVSFNGKLEELRITKGVGRDLTIVPTAAFPNP